MARNVATAHNAFTGVFLVGLGLIALLHYWWPGIMFVVAAALFVKALVEGQLASHVVPVGVLVIIGGIAVLGERHLHLGIPVWPVIVIVIGVAYLVKTFWKRSL